MPASTLPTKSAPTSAPLVKIPPPRRAKMEIKDEPKAKPMSGCNTSESSRTSPVDAKTQKKTPTPSKPKPTTSIPVMAPPLNATFSASFIPMVAACAVRTLALTETFIPIKPQAPDKTDPMTKPTAVAISKKRPINIVRIKPTTAMVLYWRDK